MPKYHVNLLLDEDEAEYIQKNFPAYGAKTRYIKTLIRRDMGVKDCECGKQMELPLGGEKHEGA